MNFLALICLAVIHGIVDAFSQVVSPLWPRMEEDLGHQAVTLIFAAWMVATSVSQPLFGYWGDRFGSRWLMWLAPAVAIVAISAIGLATGPISLAFLLIIGGLGIGAFHPEAISIVAAASGAKSTKALAVFIAGGMIGLGIGPTVSGALVEHYGLNSLAWMAIPGLALLSLTLLIARPHNGHTHSEENGAGLAEIFKGRMGQCLLLLLVGTFRTAPAVGIPFALAFLFRSKGLGESETGIMQSTFLLAGGLGTLACPYLIRPGRELAGLFWSALLPAGCLWMLTMDHPIAYYAGLVGSGFMLQGAMPTLIAYSQRLLPRGRRLASSIVMGSSWGLGGLIYAGLQAHYLATQAMADMFVTLIPFTLIAAVATCFLPKPSALRGFVPKPEPVLATVEPTGVVIQSTSA